jgi:CRISPR-associated protein Cas2
MMVLIVERAPAGLRGELTRWLLEPRAGVFVGRVSATVREKLWERTCKGLKGGAAMLIWRTNNEQGFEFQIWGDPSRSVTDWEGLKLVTMRHDRYPKRRRPTKNQPQP